jgi:beta,beta-carotene 9',10'-dioxygenase
VQSEDSAWLDKVVKADVETGQVTTWAEPGQFPGEPVFVAAPGAEAEDTGVLLSVVLDGDRGTSFLLVLDATTLTELARAQAPHVVPFGFHRHYVS